MSAEEVREALSEMQLEAARRGNAPREAVPGEKHTFWDTQPVPSFDDDTDALEPAGGGPIHPAEPDKVKQEPYSLPGSFEWAELDLTDEAQANELYTLLHENYVEDGDNMFRFDYSIPFIRWAMQPPGHRNEWHVGVRVSQTKKLVAFIGCTPADLLCHGKRVEPGPVVLAEGEAEPSNASAASKPADTAGGEQQSVVEVNFLCVHKKLRSKRLAPVSCDSVPSVVGSGRAHVPNVASRTFRRLSCATSWPYSAQQAKAPHRRPRLIVPLNMLPRTGAHSRNHQASQSSRDLPGFVYCRGSAAEARRAVPLLASFAQSKEVD
eukprot:scaffold106401_cov33-Tisochrysis_lutea.AAC.1